ncbi:MAG: AAA family ATPase [Gammaproteobacteria bacterium]|nr:AAA family ATPase [Gammaproteobacteria bacterium]
MKLYATRSVHRTQLLDVEKAKCWQAIDHFRRNPWHPSLNYEPLAKGRGHNHCSIRASLELRVILAVEPDFANPANVILVRMDHHDPAYRWAERQGFQTDADDGRNLDGGAGDPTSIATELAELDRLEEWMLFLHPDQQALVERQFAAEARIRGGAGTGKTVVALHRAAVLGRRYDHDKILFTTFSRSLTDHLERLLRDLPDSPPNVEFLNIDRIAAQLVPTKPDVNPSMSRAAFDDAYQDVIVGTSMESVGPEYLRAEIERVIKGRGAGKDEYLDTSRFERLGRKRSFNKAERELCWQLRDAWDRRMRQADCIDFPDRLVMARDVVREQNTPPYRAEIIDEAQDCTTVAVQLVRALVAGAPANRVPPDGLLLLDDAAQRIYRGGSRPAWAGLTVKGSNDTGRANR